MIWEHYFAELKQQFEELPGAGQRLLEALTHRSYAVENNLSYDNQRLEFLGDAVLEIVLSDQLFKFYPEANEGVLTRIRSGLVREVALAKVAQKLGLANHIRIGKGEQEAGGNERPSTLADAFEAVLGALYLEAGLEAAREFIMKLFRAEYPDPKVLLQGINPKGELQEFSQSRWNEHPEYSVVSVSGPEHQPTYEVQVQLHGLSASARASGRKAAESEAARRLLEKLSDHLQETEE